MNENIISYIKDNYINSKMDPQFAVLVKGDWGSGKTFLVRKILEETYGKKYENNIIWLSVYGISTIDQLQQKLFEKTHPVLTSKVAKFAFATVKAGLKATTSLDLNKDNKDDILFDFAIPEFEKDIGGKKVKIKKLLIVDDIERCSIPIMELFGFFSEEILDNKVRAIFISNDQIIKDLEDSSKKEDKNSEESAKEIINTYRATKEKIIGMEFEVLPDIPEAARKFINEIGLNKYEKVLVDKTMEVLNNLNYKNLRTVRQAFVHISQIINNLKTKSLDAKYISLVIEYFLVLFIQKANGKIDKENEFLDAIQVYAEAKQTLEEYKNVHAKNAYPLFRLTKVPLQHLYYKIIQKGNYSSELICNDYKEWTTPDAKKTPYQKMIEGWFYLSDSEFKKYYDSIEKDFAKNKITNQMIILNWADFKFCFLQEGMISGTASDIKNFFLDYIKTNQDSLDLCEADICYEQHLISCKKEINKLNEIKEALKKVNRNLLKESVKNSFITIYSRAKIVPAEVLDLIAYNRYNSYGIPILSLIDINDFYQKIKNASYENQVVIFQCLQDRYGMKNNESLKKDYYPDTNKVRDLAKLYKQDAGNTLMSPENAKRNRLSQWYTELYNYMKQFSVKPRKKKNNKEKK